MFDVCVIGHVTRDTVAVAGQTARQPGGVAYYTAMACRGLGLGTAVLTKVAEADREGLLGDLTRAGARVVCLESTETTEFENLYAGDTDTRMQKVRALAAPFAAADLGELSAAVFHLGPLIGGDMPAALIAEAAARGGLVSLDVQGFLREARDGGVVARDWPEKAAGLAPVHILKTDREEARILTGEDDPERAARALAAYGPGEILVTMGGAGSLVHAGGETHRIAAYPPRRLADATGCGDTYVAGYLFRRLASDDPAAAGRFAAAAASLKLERFGPFTGGADEVEAVLRRL